MTMRAVKRVHCESQEAVKMGHQKNGTPRCKCKNCKKTFQTDYVNKGAKSETKRLIERYSNESFKKTEEKLTDVNPKYINLKKPLAIRIKIDELWSRVCSKKTP